MTKYMKDDERRFRAGAQSLIDQGRKVDVAALAAELKITPQRAVNLAKKCGIGARLAPVAESAAKLAQANRVEQKDAPAESKPSTAAK